MHPIQLAIPEISIHRHCMQQLLHDAISSSLHVPNEQEYCQGLLTGSGNMIKKHLSVTKNAANIQHSIKEFITDSLKTDSNPDAFIAVYLATCDISAINPKRIQSLTQCLQSNHINPPAFYLLLELGHKGRVEARLFADATLSIAMPLNMQEDSIRVVTHG